jgi:predicted RNA-binding Zn ribbon-like protein
MGRPAAAALPDLATAQAAGFPVGGEPLAVDLADTIVTVADPPVDLLGDDHACSRFWQLQGPRLPPGWAQPSPATSRELRDAIRRLLDATLAGQHLDGAALAVVNAASASISASLEAVATDTQLRRVKRWHAANPTDLALGAAARSAIALLTDPSNLARLRRCANPSCSMLFTNGDNRRQWCTPNICGNRTRVARHYRRHRPNGTTQP